MKQLGSTIIINRGEVFTTRFDFVDSDGNPFVLSNKWVNAYCLITVSSSVYCQYGKYQRNYWLDLSNRPKFVNRDIVPQPSSNPTVAFENVYYTIASDGTKTYTYWNGTEYKPYSFVITKKFINDDTADWIESIYKYEIKVVDGEDMRTVLTGLYTGIYKGPPADVLSNEQIWWLISKKKPELVENINYNAALANYYVCDILLKPSKLIINANI